MKARDVSATRQTAIVMDLSDLEREAGTIVARAQAEAAKIVADAKAQAQREAEQLRAEARETGRMEGLQAGTEAGQQQGHDEAVAQTAQGLTDLISRWSQTLDVFQQNMPMHVADAKSDLVRLAIAIAQRVTHQEALRNAKVSEATLESTLRLIGTARKAVLHVNSGEFTNLENYVPELLTKVRGIDAVELKPDDTITPGGCIVQFGAGQVDARLETQIQRIADELLAGD
jgi:flagellar assembly protein FliH